MFEWQTKQFLTFFGIFLLLGSLIISIYSLVSALNALQQLNEGLDPDEVNAIVNENEAVKTNIAKHGAQPYANTSVDGIDTLKLVNVDLPTDTRVLDTSDFTFYLWNGSTFVAEDTVVEPDVPIFVIDLGKFIIQNEWQKNGAVPNPAIIDVDGTSITYNNEGALESDITTNIANNDVLGNGLELNENGEIVIAQLGAKPGETLSWNGTEWVTSVIPVILHEDTYSLTFTGPTTSTVSSFIISETLDDNQIELTFSLRVFLTFDIGEVTMKLVDNATSQVLVARNITGITSLEQDFLFDDDTMSVAEDTVIDIVMEIPGGDRILITYFKLRKI